MSEVSITLPSRDELRQFPRWAWVAFASRITEQSAARADLHAKSDAEADAACADSAACVDATCPINERIWSDYEKLREASRFLPDDILARFGQLRLVVAPEDGPNPPGLFRDIYQLLCSALPARMQNKSIRRAEPDTWIEGTKMTQLMAQVTSDIEQIGATKKARVLQRQHNPLADAEAEVTMLNAELVARVQALVAGGIILQVKLTSAAAAAR